LDTLETSGWGLGEAEGGMRLAPLGRREERVFDMNTKTFFGWLALAMFVIMGGIYALETRAGESSCTTVSDVVVKDDVPAVAASASPAPAASTSAGEAK